jgi:hypothetical protein
MTDFVIEYSPEGQIIRYGYMQSGRAMHAYPLHGGQMWVTPHDDAEELFAILDPNLHFFDPASQEFLHRPMIGQNDRVSIPADGVFEARIPVIENTRVIVAGEEFVIGADDNEFVFSTDEPGIYRFEISPPFPYRSFTIEVTADEV